MNSDALEIFDRCVRSAVVLSRRGEKLHVEALGLHPAPPDLLADLAGYKIDLLALLDYMAAADALLRDSTRALAREWPIACVLDDEWDRLENEAHDAYWSLDRDRLRAALADRDAHALAVFARHDGAELWRRGRQDADDGRGVVKS